MSDAAANREMAEQARQIADLTAQLRRLRDFAELSSDWFWEQDADLRFTGFDGISTEKLRRRQHDFIGRHRWDLPIRCASPQALAEHIAICERHEPFRNFVYEIPAQNGEPQCFSISGMPIFDAAGLFLGYRGVGRNITELVRAEQATAASEQRLAQIIDSSLMPTFVIDAQHRVTHWNRACAAVTGIPASEVLGRAEAWRGFYPSARPTMADIILDGLGEKGMQHYYAGKCRPSPLIEGGYEAEDFFPHMQGGRWLFFSAAPLFDAEGRVAGAIDILQDVTARKQAEAAEHQYWGELQQAHVELKRAMQQLVEAEKLASLGRLVAGISHELNTPLGNALVVASGLREKVDTLAAEYHSQVLRRSSLASFLESAAQISDILTSNIQRATRLVDRFRQVSSDQSDEQPRIFSLAHTVDNVLLMLHGRLAAAEVRVEADLAQELRIESFPGALEQILVNLVDNALVHGFAGRCGGLVRIAAEERGGRITLDFVDNGGGMSEETRRHAFDPFFTTRLGQGGSGLGLYLVHNLATGRLGGRVEVLRSDASGTAVRLEFPRSIIVRDT